MNCTKNGKPSTDDQLDNLMKQVQTELELRQGNEILINALSQKTTNKNALMEMLEQEKEMTALEAKEIGLIDDIF